MRIRSEAVLWLAILIFPNAAMPQKRAITEKDLFDFHWVANPQVSPDGMRVAFTQVVVDEKRTGYESSIWSVATTGGAEPIRMTAGKHDSNPRWSPDGRHIAFVRVGEKEGKPIPPQIALLPLDGGEARNITDLPKGAASLVWSPDGKRIAFLSSTTQGDVEGKEKSAAQAEHESDVRVITRAVYRSNNEGYIDPKRHFHIWVIDVPAASGEAARPRQLTSGEFDEGEIVWSPDGSRIYFLPRRIDEPYYESPATDIFSVPSNGGEPAKLASVPMGISDLALSPDGSRFAFHGSVTQPVRSYSQADVWVMNALANAAPRNLTADFDFDMGDSVSGDNSAPRGGNGRTLHWSSDGRMLFDVVSNHGRTQLVRLSAQSGEVTEMTRGDQAVLDFTLTPDTKSTVALLSTPVMIGDLFSVAPDGSLRRLTDVNRELWARLNLTPPEEINYTSFDGRRIQAWVQKPPDFDSGKKYPLILNIHGGPHSAYGWTFDHEFQWMAAKGYVVLYPNPRGSTSYGQEFGNVIQYHYPGDDYRDLMAGVDELIQRGYVDEKKLGVTGGSGGGVLTNWTVTHTDRFAAAVSQRDISNWAAW